MMEVGVPGQSLALAPEHVEVEFAPAADCATILREYYSNKEAESMSQN